MRAIRRAVFADHALQARLAEPVKAQPFAALLMSEAQCRRLDLAPDHVTALLAPDPLGLARFALAPPDGEHWPTGQWLPVSADASRHEPTVDWLYFGGRRPSEPFFEDTVRTVQQLPFNRAFRYRMRLADFIAAAEAGPEPDGLIFHMSRCGSTLAAQMLAALPGSLVLSEPAVLDEILQATLPLGADAAVAALRATAAAFGRPGGAPFVLKLDCWHALALPLFRRAFPNTPWVFLYRDPVEVLVSHIREPSAQIVPGGVAPLLPDSASSESHDDHCARMLAAVCAAAAQELPLGGGVAIDYRQLPAALEDIVLPHFHIAADAGARAAMAQAGLRDAKAPHRAFAPDADEKRRAAGTAVEAAATHHLARVYAQLGALQQAASGRTAAPLVT